MIRKLGKGSLKGFEVLRTSISGSGQQRLSGSRECGGERTRGLVEVE